MHTRRTFGPWMLLAVAGLAATPGAASAWARPQPVAAPAQPEGEPPADAPVKPGVSLDPVTQRALEDDDLAEVVKARLRSSFLRDEERRALRLEHGVWGEGDLTTTTDRARIALDRGAYGDASLSDEAVPALSRARGALERGDPLGALALVEGEDGLAVSALRVRALVDLGRAPEAVKLGGGVLDALEPGALTSAADIVSTVRIAMMLADLRGAPDDARARSGGDYQTMMSLLAKARKADPLDWRVPLTEAQLLFDKDNFEQAQQSIRQALLLNPTAAEAWAVLGHMAVASFNLPEAEKLARQLDLLARVMPKGGEHEEEAEDEIADGGGGEGAAASALGAGVRARLMLRQDDPEGAQQMLAGALKAMPDRRDLRAYQIAASALRYDWAATQALLDDLDAIMPGGARGYYEAGRALADSRQYGQSAKWLGEARRRAPFWAEPVAELGLLEVQSGKDNEAIEALSEAARLDPFNVRVANSLKLMREIQTYTATESAHFVIRAKSGVDTLLAREMVGPLEKIHATVTGRAPGALAHEPARRTAIDLMPDHQWFAVRIAGLPRIHTIAASTGPVIAMEAPRDGRNHRGAYNWERVIQHEYAHTVGLSRTGNRIPHWFTEANAVYLELSPRDYNAIKILTEAFEADALFDFTEINIAFTRPRKPTDRAQAYAQGHWMFQYIVEKYGPEAPLKLMDQYARGVREEEGFQAVLGVSRDEFMNGFKPWAAKTLVDWGMRPREGQPTLRELIERSANGAGAGEGGGAPEMAGGGDGIVIDAGGEGEELQATPQQVAQWLAQYPDHPDVLELAVKQALGALPENAEPGVGGADLRPLLERYAKARPVDPLPVRQLARLALAGSTPEDAVPYLEWLDAREQYTPTYASQLATLYAGLGAWDKAGEKAERATRIAPYQAAHRELAAMAAIKRGDTTGARRHIEFLIALEPDREIHRKRMEALGRMKDEG